MHINFINLTVYSLPPLIALCVVLWLGLFVYTKNPSGAINRRFFGWLLSLSLWHFGTFLTYLADNPTSALLSVRISHLGVTLIPATFLHFMEVFVHGKSLNKRLLIAAYFVSVVFEILNLTPFFIASVSKMSFSYYNNGGPIYGLFIAYFGLIVAYCLFILLRRVKRSTGRERTHAKLLLIGFVIAYVSGVCDFLPMYKINIYPPGNIFNILFVGIVAYTILVHKWLDIEVIIKKTLVFAGLFTVIMLVISTVTTIVQGILGRFFQIPTMVSTALSVLAAIALYDPSKKILVNFTDKYLFQKKLDYTALLKEASQEMAAIKSLKALAKVVVAFLIKKARIVSAAVFVQSDTGAYVLRASRPVFRGLNRILRSDHPLVEEVNRLLRPVDREEITNRFATKSHQGVGGDRELKQCLELFDMFKADVVVPSFLYPQSRSAENGHTKNPPLLRSLLFLGPKKSDEPYTQEDLDIFFTLAQESAIAVENARLYDEAVRKTEQLREMNQELANANERLQVTQASLIVAEKNATMAGMAKAIGHEVNNPLTTVILRIDKIHTSKVKKFKEAIERITPQVNEEETKTLSQLCQSIDDDSQSAYRAAQRINAVVHTLTDILRDAKGEMGPLSLIVLFREALEATRFSTYEENLTGCDIKVAIATNIIVFGNLEQLLQAFVNLIKNAFEAMGDVRERKIWIRGGMDAEDPRMARIEVEDNGPGIPPEVLPRIWNQGFSTKPRKDNSIGAPGQGQGLFVVRHMIESVHKGSISCESEVGRGTKFIIRLPLAEEKPL